MPDEELLVRRDDHGPLSAEDRSDREQRGEHGQERGARRTLHPGGVEQRKPSRLRPLAGDKLPWQCGKPA